MKILDVIEHKSTISLEPLNEETFKGLNVVNLDFPLGEVFPVDGPSGDRFAVGLGTNEIIQFEAQGRVTAKEQAENFLAKIREENTVTRNGKQEPKPLTKEMLKKAARATPTATLRSLAGFKQSLSRLAAQASASNYADLEKIPKVGPFLNHIMTSPSWKGFFKIVAAVGFPLMAYANMIEIINELQTEAEATQDQELKKKNYELSNILIGQLSIQVLLVLFIIFRDASLFRKALRAIKWTVRAIQGGAALTGVGTIPSIISLLITEAGWLVAGLVISSPTVQRALAEYLHGLMFIGTGVAFVGSTVRGAAQVLDTVFDGAYGTSSLRRDLGWDSKSADAPDKEVTASSEWAKLVFKGLLFPPGKEKHLVPYMTNGQRTAALESVFGFEQQIDPITQSANDNQTQADQAMGPR